MIKDAANKLIEGFYGILPYETAVHIANAQKEFAKRAKLNGLATTGRYSSEMESQAA